MKKFILLILFISVSISNFAQDESVNGNLIITNGAINLNSTHPTDPYTSISFRHQNEVKWLMDYGTSTTDDFRILKFNSATSASSFLQLDFANNQFEILNSNVGIGTANPIEKLHVEGSLLLDAYQSGNQKGLFFREGFSTSNKYNLSILTYDDGDNSPDALDINAYDGIYFNTGSNSRNPRMTVQGNGNVGIGTTNPTAKLYVVGNLNTTDHINANQYISVSKGGSARVAMNGQGHGYITGRNDNVENKFLIHSNGSSWFNGGNVGIGTTNPEGKLQVKDLNTTPIVNITGKAPNTGNDELVSEIRLSNLYDNLPGHRASIKAISDKSGSHGNVAFQFSTSLWNGNHTEVNALRIASDGNVGIGTTNPDAKLRVQGTHSLGRFYTDTDGRFEIQATRSSSTALNSDLVLSSQQHIVLDPNRHGTTGNVGIGTYTPDAKLAVNGNIHTKEVKVDLVGWPDYVFEEDYNLPTLQEVEQHISEKGHLENIPSAAEVAENGVQLGEMNKKLLEKIEQLTLYMIEQNKKTDLLLNEVEALKKKNAALEARLK